MDDFKLQKELDEFIAVIGTAKKDTMALLQAIQEKYNYLPKESLSYLSGKTEIPISHVLGVATFFTNFRLKPAGRHFIKVCVGTACHVKGARALYDRFKTYLKIPENEDTDKDSVFTVMEVACLGCCMLAPAVQIDDIIYGPLTQESVPEVIRDFLESKKMKEAVFFSTSSKKVQASIKMCLCSSCVAAGSKAVFDEIRKQVMTDRLSVALKTVGCTGISFQTPLVEIDVNERSFRYGAMKPSYVSKMLSHHFVSKDSLVIIKSKIRNCLKQWIDQEVNEPVTRFLLASNESSMGSFTQRQKTIATQFGGELDPLNIDEYLEYKGFQALKGCLESENPESVIAILKDSGLRGRGGGGYLTAQKWENVRKCKSQHKYLICNADEGDPGAFMDRMLLESFPFRIIEGILIAAFSARAQKGYFFIRSEYPLAISRIEKALDICKQKGFVGQNIMGCSFNFDLEIFVSAGAFVCGEETAMIASIEGKRGNPRLRPPYPSEVGIFGHPTLVNNVETFASVPWIVLHGSHPFKSMGTAVSPGTKCFALAGKVRQGGLIEVEMGITIREIVYEIGQGVTDDKKLKAVQIGGPAGGCLPASLIDTIVDYETLKGLGTIMGSGGMIVLDEDDCMVDIALYFMSFTQNESCGKCTFCRIGTKRLQELLIKISQGQAAKEDLNNLEILAKQIKHGSLCGLGRAAPNPVLSTLYYFRDEFEAHLSGICPAKKCKALIRYRINDKCIGCTKCAQRCPVDAIPMTPYFVHEIKEELCVRCDVCRQICPVHAVQKENVVWEK